MTPSLIFRHLLKTGEWASDDCSAVGCVLCCSTDVGGGLKCEFSRFQQAPAGFFAADSYDESISQVLVGVDCAEIAERGDFFKREEELAERFPRLLNSGVGLADREWLSAVGAKTVASLR